MFVALPRLAEAVAGREQAVADATGATLELLARLIDGSARATPELQQRLSTILGVEALELFEPCETLARLVGGRRVDPAGEVGRRVAALCR